MKNLGNLNNLYNAQDVILLCEIAENRFKYMYELYSFNPRRSNSASTLSGCIEREMSKVIIALPTTNKSVEVFEQTITGSFNSVNTQLAFDIEILLPNFIENTTSEDNTDNSDDLRKDYNYKTCYKLKLDNEKEYATKRVITKILKLDENNQYGYGMVTVTNWLYKTRH